jgi:hypothetical protein
MKGGDRTLTNGVTRPSVVRLLPLRIPIWIRSLLAIESRRCFDYTGNSKWLPIGRSLTFIR